MNISKSNAVQATTAEQLVAEADYVKLSRLVIEHAWRADHGRVDTIHELYVDDVVLDVGMPLRGRQAIREWDRQLVAATPWRSIRHGCGNMRFVADGANVW
jgi:hypothetical protein